MPPCSCRLPVPALAQQSCEASASESSWASAQPAAGRGGPGGPGSEESLFPGSQARVTVRPVLPASLWAAPRPPAPSVREQSVWEPGQSLGDATMSLFLPGSPPPSLPALGSVASSRRPVVQRGQEKFPGGRVAGEGTPFPASLQGSRSPDIVFHPWKKEENGDQSRLILYTINLTNPLAPKTATVRETQVRGRSGRLAGSVLRGG